ncbi:MAG: hypothetical protein HYT79_03990 [Elusimicrobia bacterium]|nr:hypothetical protein [Elusimicrobiota bacterium]
MGNTKKLTISVPKKEFQQAISYAKREGITQASHLVREAIEAWLEPRLQADLVKAARPLYEAVAAESASLAKAGGKIAAKHWPKD